MPRRVRRAVEFCAPTLGSVLVLAATAPFRPANSFEVETWAQGTIASTWWLALGMAVMGLPCLAVGVALALLEIRHSGLTSAHAPLLFSMIGGAGLATVYLFRLFAA